MAVRLLKACVKFDDGLCKWFDKGCDMQDVL